MLEIEALQSSSNKLNEDRIFDLKQRIEDLMMERDTFNAQNKQQKKELSSLRYQTTGHRSTYVTTPPYCSAQLINTEQERDKLSIEINRLGMQCQQLKSTQERLVAEHSKTLERVNELWKQKWPGAYDEVGFMPLGYYKCLLVREIIFISSVFLLLPCSKRGRKNTSLLLWYIRMCTQAH